MNKTWQNRFVSLAQHVAHWSKDPSTKVGAVIVDQHRRVVGLGYNGFPRGVKDIKERYYDREQKYPRVVHAEMNALLNATKTVESCTLFTWPLNCCSRCAGMIIQSGITTVYQNPMDEKEIHTRWADEYQLAIEMFHEAGIRTPTVQASKGPMLDE